MAICMAIAMAIVIAVAAGIPGLAWAEDQPPPLPFRTDAAAATPGAGQWLAAGLACAVLLGVMLWWLRRRGAPWPGLAPAGGQTLKVLQRMPLTAQTQLVQLLYGDRVLLLAVGASYSTCLRDDPLPQAPPTAGGAPA